MAIVEGEPFRCNMHGFETDSREEWNDHCFGNPEHTEAGLTSCIKCGVIIRYSNLPWHKINDKGSKNISLLCETCDTQHVGNVKVSKVE